MAKELESLCACLALDIEFGLDRTGKLYLFQVRRMARARHWHPVTERRVARQLEFVERFVQECSLPREGVVGERTILAIMPDWNPAELIGTTPQPLSSSLYRTLITRSTWREARAEMGYQELGDGELMYLINSHPYIDVRMSFNSFLPEGLDRDTGGKLVSAWMNRLESCPELHDKIEFDIVPTCLDFCFEHDFSERYPNILSTAEREQYTQALRILTRNAIGPKQDSTLDRALELAAQLDALRLTDVNHAEPHAFLVRASHLLKACRRLGVKPFAVAARHAFIAEALLRSAVRRNGLRQERLDEFKRSIRTITGNIVNEYSQVCHGEISREDFLTRYGHLRPGTYEITSLRYDERDDLFHDQAPQLAHSTTPVFSMNEDECTAIDGLLRECGLDVLNSRQLLAYAGRAIAAREQIKFIFSRTLSNALSDLVSWGEKIGLSREDLSFLDWASIESSLTVPPMDFLDRHYLAQVAASRIQMEAAHEFKLAHIIFSVRDIYVATLNRSIPNFVGTGAASGRIVKLTAEMSARVNIQGMIVCIENADPGFDWIFTQHPAALVTRFGGANSHMAIRCAEFGLPAAIGCGDSLYARLTQAGAAELNCAEKILRPLHAK
ncbi:PEP-utilizing enzyme [Achromobacter xylosoxidans]